MDLKTAMSSLCFAQLVNVTVSALTRQNLEFVPQVYVTST